MFSDMYKVLFRLATDGLMSFSEIYVGISNDINEGFSSLRAVGDIKADKIIFLEFEIGSLEEEADVLKEGWAVEYGNCVGCGLHIYFGWIIR